MRLPRNAGWALLPVPTASGSNNAETDGSLRSPSVSRRAFCIVAFSVLSLCGSLVANDDTRFIAGLRERRLFDLAETYCNDRLSDQQLNDEDRVQLSVELIRVYTEHALNTRGGERDALWQKVETVAASFANQDLPRVVLVQVQAALSTLARGELARLESEVSASADDALKSARETLRSAASALTEIDRELTDAIPLRRRNPLRPHELSAEELTSLQNHVRYQLARCWKNQALCYPEASSDRTASLTAAIDQLAQPLAQLDSSQSLYFDLRLEQIICLRLLRDTDAAVGYLKSLLESDVLPSQQLSVRAERIRWHLARGESSAALKVAGEGRMLEQTTSPELDFALLETYISLWKSAADAGDSKEAATWRDRSVAAAKFVEQEHGAYWGRRGELLLVRIGGGSGDGSVEILRRTADDLYRKGKFADAVAAYDKAAEAAMKTQASTQSFALSYKAALVLQQQTQYAAAAERFWKLAVAMSDYEHAANAHRLAIENTRKASAAAGKWLDTYDDLLNEHLKLWPSSSSASTVAYWLGELEIGRRHWPEAINAFAQVGADSPLFASTVKKLGQCWSAELGELSDGDKTIKEELHRASDMFRRIVLDSDGNLPAQWSVAAREAVVAQAAIWMNYGQAGFAEIEELLKASLAGEPGPGDAWRIEATSLLVGIVARQPGRQSDAQELLGQVGAASTTRLFELFQQFTSLTNNATGAAKVDLARLTLAVADHLGKHRGELDQRQLLAVDRGSAIAFAASGDDEAAYGLFSQLAKDHPNSGSIQEDFANFLLASDQDEYLRESLDQWRRIAARIRPRTSSWFRAKYSIALTQYRLNDKAGAAKLIKYLQATENLTESGMEQEFADLLQQCEL